jgi:hypothetical protein
MNQDRLYEASARGARWLAEHRDGDGFLSSTEVCLDACYKALWALGLHGHAPAARALGRIVASWLDDDGDVPAPRRPDSLERHYLYPNAYLVIGARANGLDELARTLYRFVRTRRHPQLGGFYTEPPGHGAPLSMDTASTAIAGLAALSLGDAATAAGAADFLRSALEGQPEPGVAFYTAVSSGGEVVTAGPPERRALRIGLGETGQAWYFIGLATLFLPALHEVTGDAAHLELARRYLDLYLDCGEDAITDASSGKCGVGAAHIYRLTAEPRCREVALTVAEGIAGRQDCAGCWRWDRSDPVPPDALDPADLDLTAEYVIWLHQISSHLAAARVGCS